MTQKFIKTANILITGGAGFIGSNLIRYILEKTDFSGKIVNYDKLTYAGNLMNLKDIEDKYGGHTYFFEMGDISDYDTVDEVFKKYNVEIVVHLAAESHVDRSIFGPTDFIQANINGTFTLLEVARKRWATLDNVRFHHISTDEVYGSLGDTGYFHESTAYDPRSPYSASKAASDHIARAYYHTYDLPITISNCSNNYGPYQFPEKLIPLIILNAIERKNLPIYGDGKNIRDWLHVEDHCNAIWLVLNSGINGETYNIGGECEMKNVEVVNMICELLEDILPNNYRYKDLISFVKDRPGHDKRYAIDCSKIKSKLGWKKKYTFEDRLRDTILWYLGNRDWVKSIKSGFYKKWLEKNYDVRDRSLNRI